MTYNREFYTIFVVDTRSIRYFCGRKPNDIETDEDKEAVIFSLTGTPCTDKPVFLRRRPLERILSADRARPVDGQPDAGSLLMVRGYSGCQQSELFSGSGRFLKKYLIKNDKGFSTVDSIMDTPLPSYGFDYTLYKVATSDTTYTALVSYVAKNSPAEDAGLERGNWIMLVDGDSITKKTEERLIDGGARTLRIGKYVIVKEENNGGTEGDTENGENEEEEDKEVGIIQETGDVALPAVRPVTESAIYDTNFIQLKGTDYKIAYLAYNSFTAGTAEQSEKYNNELRAFSQECKQRGINNLVLDFRYNSGGEMECVQLLADILVPADKLESPFAFLQYNDKQSAQNRDLILDSQLLQGGVNLNLPTVYIITSGTTAGAAEMLINCLKPYMKVVLIGQTTKGEYVATETFINPKYPWAVRPVVCEVFNSNGEADYSAGFKPDIAINETSYLQYYLPLGEPDEILLHTALQVIAGIVELPTPKQALP